MAALVPLCYKLPYKDTGGGISPLQDRCFTLSLLLAATSWIQFVKRVVGLCVCNRLLKGKGDGFSVLCCRDSRRHGGGGGNEKQLRLLESYLVKLQHHVHGGGGSKKKDAGEELDSLNAYLDKTKATLDSLNLPMNNQPTGNPVGTGYRPETVQPEQKNQNGSFLELRNKGSTTSTSWMAQSLQQSDDDTSSLYLVGILASINIAVFLFEIATPVRSSQFQLFSLPLLYGAKINDLILTGEWWRLVTPMFLHSGVLHVAFGCWSLVTFGPEVCRRYGSFTFLLIYVLGGLSGNLTSFLHTPDPSVGGTGPVFSIIGAWLVYNNQTKDVTHKDTSESLFQKAMMTTALSFILSHFGPIDDWTHLGSITTGIVYGFFTCPTLQLDDASLGSGGKDEGNIAVVERRPDVCKSLMFFAIFTLFLGSLLLIVEPPLGTSVTEKDILGL
ncbi:RHOMBOID-like protein 9, chloroplastic [Linum grandiflorum]